MANDQSLLLLLLLLAPSYLDETDSQLLFVSTLRVRCIGKSTENQIRRRS